MSKISRRGILGLFGGVAALPVVKVEAAAPVAEWPVLTAAEVAEFRHVSWADYANQETVNLIVRNNALLSHLHAQGKIKKVDHIEWGKDDDA